ncbi:sulfite exporter TauE/SafE family protein [Corynebacterium lizhenjunii]|uniref:Probable membrane transporter protein n=1 Tax=Corynebacterium lizhenjunii TaxID=2709394 RepID=A0A7T0KHQ2_9CORY|nr:sulfite exporter TauE/SafE family protein [Corynebacterium lizhenjunii]QPK80305.1 sulfite exporter TauE/SafE family protein [Corynebacterium lizhenjunii]
MLTAAVVFATITAGALMQRVSGMGMGLIGGPILMLLLGPVEGIMVVNVLACINAIMQTINVREHVDWKKFAQIGSVMVFGSLPAAYLISTIDTAPLLILSGSALLVALAMVTVGKKYVPHLEGTGPLLSAGVIGGFTNTLAGVAGPVITVYAQAARWPHQMFAATLQPIFMVGGAISVVSKLLLGAGGFAGTTWLVWPAGVAGMIVGIAVGNYLSRRIPRDVAHKLSLMVATAGAAVAVWRGFSQL